MLDIKFIRENTELVREAIRSKSNDVNLDSLLEMDRELVKKRQELDALQSERNRLSQNFNRDGTSNDSIERGRILNNQIKGLKDDIVSLSDRFHSLMLRVPNIPDPTAPIGPDESHNIVVYQSGIIPEFDFPVRDHTEIITLNEWGNFKQLSNITGSRTYLLAGKLARLELVLWQFAFDKLEAAGFMPLNIPSLAKEHALVGTGHLPGGEEEIYRLEKDGLLLSGTAEVVINSLHADEILDEERLPLLYAGFSPCFRREAGSAGKDVKGLLRVHQFSKVEQFVICKADEAESRLWHERLLRIASEILNDLELPYQVVECCTGDMGAGKVRMHDIETWMPSLGRYRETHSCSTLHDWQARRTNTRYRSAETGKATFVHTLNNTAIATPRIIAPLLENHQKEDGSVRVPKALQRYLPGATL